MIHMNDALAHHRSCLVLEAAELAYDFGPGHPLQARRLVALMDLLETSGLWHSANEQTHLAMRSATMDELRLIHTADYIAAVRRLSEPEAFDATPEQRQERQESVMRYGFGEGDTPALPDMHEVSARIAGGSLVAMSAVMDLPA